MESAWRAVKEMLLLSWPDKIEEFEEKWGRSLEWFSTNNMAGDDLLQKHIMTRAPELF